MNSGLSAFVSARTRSREACLPGSRDHASISYYTAIWFWPFLSALLDSNYFFQSFRSVQRNPYGDMKSPRKPAIQEIGCRSSLGQGYVLQHVRLHWWEMWTLFHHFSHSPQIFSIPVLLQQANATCVTSGYGRTVFPKDCLDVALLNFTSQQNAWQVTFPNLQAVAPISEGTWGIKRCGQHRYHMLAQARCVDIKYVQYLFIHCCVFQSAKQPNQSHFQDTYSFTVASLKLPFLQGNAQYVTQHRLAH